MSLSANAAPAPAFRIGWIADAHIYRLTAWPWQLLGKRARGMANLWLNRRKTFHPRHVAQTLARVDELRLDHLVFLGDVTQTALPSEFRLARRMLAAATTPRTIIPGNHDRYTIAAHHSQRFERALRELGGGEDYPVRVDLSDPRVALICVDPCRPDLRARGTMPARQLSRFAELFAEVADEGRVALVACHYPLAVPDGVHHGAGHALSNLAALREVIASVHVPVVFANGHIHRTWLWEPPGLARVLTMNPGAVGLAERAPLPPAPPQPAGAGLIELSLAAGDLGGPIAATFRQHRIDLHGAWQTRTLVELPDLRAVGQDGAAAAGRDPIAYVERMARDATPATH